MKVEGARSSKGVCEGGHSSAHIVSGELMWKPLKGNCNWLQVTLVSESNQIPGEKAIPWRPLAQVQNLTGSLPQEGSPAATWWNVNISLPSSLLLEYPTGNITLIFQRKIVHYILLIRNVQYCDEFFVKS